MRRRPSDHDIDPLVGEIGDGVVGPGRAEFTAAGGGSSVVVGLVLGQDQAAPAGYSVYVELASVVDDGEAATIAVAAQRNLQLATDDRKARRLCAERRIPEPLRTLALIHAYDHIDEAGQ